MSALIKYYFCENSSAQNVEGFILKFYLLLFLSKLLNRLIFHRSFRTKYLFRYFIRFCVIIISPIFFHLFFVEESGIFDNFWVQNSINFIDSFKFIPVDGYNLFGHIVLGESFAVHKIQIQWLQGVICLTVLSKAAVFVVQGHYHVGFRHIRLSKVWSIHR